MFSGRTNRPDAETIGFTLKHDFKPCKWHIIYDINDQISIPYFGFPCCCPGVSISPIFSPTWWNSPHLPIHYKHTSRQTEREQRGGGGAMKTISIYPRTPRLNGAYKNQRRKQICGLTGAERCGCGAHSQAAARGRLALRPLRGAAHRSRCEQYSWVTWGRKGGAQLFFVLRGAFASCVNPASLHTLHKSQLHSTASPKLYINVYIYENGSSKRLTVSLNWRSCIVNIDVFSNRWFYSRD